MKKFFGRSMMVLTMIIVSACVPKAGQPANGDTSGAVSTGDTVIVVSGTMASGTNETLDPSPMMMGEPTVINSGTSMVERKATKIGGGHNGTINLKEGVIMMDEGMMVGGSLVMDMNTIAVLDIPADNSSNASLVTHLKSADFFATEEYTEAMFLATSIDSTGFPTIIANGDMTIKGVTKPMTIILHANEGLTQLTGSVDIDRTEFGVMYSSTKLLDTIKDKAIDDIFTLKFTLMLDESSSMIDMGTDSTVTPIESVSGSMDDTSTSGMSDDEVMNEVEKMINEIE